MIKEICFWISRKLFNYLELKAIDASEKEGKDVYLDDIIRRILTKEKNDNSN